MTKISDALTRPLVQFHPTTKVPPNALPKRTEMLALAGAYGKFPPW